MDRIKTLFLLILICITTNDCFSQGGNDSLLVQQLLSRILHLQNGEQKDFPSGLIPSYREYYHNRNVLKNDDNIFFTGLVVFAIRSVQPHLDNFCQRLCDSIIDLAASRYPSYQNKKGRPTYNFWRTDQPEIFPNGGWLNLFNKSQALPDDLDDTAILLLAMNSADSTVAKAHQLMQGFTNNKDYKKVKSSLPAYKNISAYSTWFGKKMPLDLDFCVLTNILLMVHNHHLQYTAADSASLDLIVKVIINRHYMNAAPKVSPHYNRTPVLLYHLSRLMAATTIPQLEKFKPQLVRDATEAYYATDNFLDKIILSTSLMRWGVFLKDDTLVINKHLSTIIENDYFVFFIANITSMLPKPFNSWLGKTGIGKFYYYCPAWNNALVIENILLKQNFNLGGRQELKKRPAE